MMMAALAAMSMFRCGSGGSRPVALGGETASDAGGTTVPARDAGRPMMDAAPVVPTVDAGLGVGVVDIADTACADLGGTVVRILAADAGGMQPFRSLQPVASRWVADFVTGAGFVTFDGAGTTVASAVGNTPIPFGFVAASGDSFALGGVSKGVVFATYDANGSLQGQAVQLSAEAPTDIALASNGSSSLVVWGAATGLRGRGVNGSMPAGAGPFDLAFTDLTGQLSSAVIDDGGGIFAFAFSGDNGGSTHQTVFGRATAVARAGDPVAIFTGSAARQVVQLAKTGQGYALLITAGDDEPSAVLLMLDPLGDVVRADRLLGTSTAMSLASLGNEVGVVALRATEVAPDAGDTSPAYAPEFRPFDATGTPIGPWVCLEQVSPNAQVGAVIAANGSGYASLINASDGSVQFAQFDHLGH